MKASTKTLSGLAIILAEDKLYISLLQERFSTRHCVGVRCEITGVFYGDDEVMDDDDDGGRALTSELTTIYDTTRAVKGTFNATKNTVSHGLPLQA